MKPAGSSPASQEPVASRALPAAPDTGASLATVKLPGRLIAVLGLLVCSIAVAGYALTGSPYLAGIGGPPTADTVAVADSNTRGKGGSPEVTPAQITAMVDKLAQRMKEKPDDAEGWTMLARSYMVLGRPADAVPAYQRAAALRKNDAGLLADWADALAASHDGRPSAESLALVERALKLDANNIKALALSGSAAFDRGDFNSAVAQWTRVAAALPPNSELATQVQVSIGQAREQARAAAAGKPLAVDGSATDSTRATPDTAATISGTVTLAPALAARAAPNDTVFVFARAATGGPMPLAVMRAKVSDLPLRFQLDDSMAMGPMAKLSSATRVIVGARISKSGDPIAHDGDLKGEAKPMSPHASGVAIEIGEVVKR